MIVNKQTLLDLRPIANMLDHKAKYEGFSHGLTECGYDIRIGETIWMFPGRRFVLSWASDFFNVPPSLMGRVLNKSSWARLGVDASMTTNIEPGWRGYLTLELRYSGWKPIRIPKGVGIAQVIFERIETPTVYIGKFQDQPRRAVRTRYYD